MKFQPTRISVKRPSKRLVIIIISAIVVLVLATYGVLSYLHWQKYDQDSEKAGTSLKIAIENSLGSDKTTPSPSAQIDKVVSDFEKTYGTNPCSVSPLYSWQTVLPQLKTSKDNCEQRFTTALAVIKTLKPLSQFLKDEKKASDLLATTIESTKAPTDYAAASAVWDAASKSDQLSKTDQFKVITTQSTEVAVNISKAYTALATAISEENKAGFDTATKDLATAYAAIDQLKTTVNTERTKLITPLITAYEKL